MSLNYATVKQQTVKLRAHSDSAWYWVPHVSGLIEHMKKYCCVHTLCGTIQFRKLQSTEIKQVLNSVDSCVLLPQLSAVVHAEPHCSAQITWIWTFAHTCVCSVDMHGPHAYARLCGTVRCRAVSCGLERCGHPWYCALSEWSLRVNM